MSEKITLSKNVYNKTQFEKTVDTTFTQPADTTLTPQATTISVAEFFNNYQSLFYQIPKLGETDSHEYLVKTSQAYIGETQSDSDLTALISEIDSLRLTIFEQQQTISTLISGSING
jgi:hypothetical protein